MMILILERPANVLTGTNIPPQKHERSQSSGAGATGAFPVFTRHNIAEDKLSLEKLRVRLAHQHWRMRRNSNIWKGRQGSSALF